MNSKLPCRNTLNKIIKKNHITKRLVDKWIIVLLEHGYNYDEMMPIFRLAKKKAELTLEKLI